MYCSVVSVYTVWLTVTSVEEREVLMMTQRLLNIIAERDFQEYT